MELASEFDAVVMLTWSDWKTEPRSNRYHYASRFRRILPVLFLQHCYTKRDGICVEPSGLDGVDIVNVSTGLAEPDVRELKQLFAARGIKRPLLWIYDSMNYGALIASMPNAFRVYHATEDYLTDTKGWNQGMELTARSVIELLPSVDFIVFVSHGIVNSYYEKGGYKGPGVVVENGCDAEHLLELAESYALSSSRADSKTPVAIFQGGINQRLDYRLVLDLVTRMPDWEFRFCGASVESRGWNRILQRTNVRYVGAVPIPDLVEHMCDSTVGIIPYIQDEWIRNSRPLKAYEYVACGLPVVTVPITALERDADLFTVASSADEFESAIRRLANSRNDPASLQRRRQAALANSYNSRFSSMCQSLLEAKAALARSRERLRIAVLYDSIASLHVSTIREHLESFDKYSRHSVTYVPATCQFWKRPAEEVLALVDLSVFDVVIIHYSVRLSVSDHLDEGLAQAIERYHGLKVLFMQDEYEGTEIARSWMDRLKFDVVYTCVPQESLEHVYPSYRFPATEFRPTLTGYVPEHPDLERHSTPLSERKLLIAYRGRKLPAVYGELGYEKYRIGVEMRSIARRRGLPVDIEVDDSKRIYGSAWYAFLGSARATLGTESGANVFDVDGSLRTQIKRTETENPQVTFEEISAKLLASHEGRVVMNQISPKIFEAIRLRTALVLFEGRYSDVVRPNEHYIPLRKDFSNIDEVLAKLNDDDYLRQITDRAYEDVIASGKFSYRRFVEGVDSDIDRRVLHGDKQNLIVGSLFSVAQDGSFKHVLPALSFGISSGPHPAGRPLSYKELSNLIADRVPPPATRGPATPSPSSSLANALRVEYGRNSLLGRHLRSVWARLPFRLRAEIKRFL